MPTLTLRPNGDNTKTDFIGVANESNLYANVDESTLSTADYNFALNFSASYSTILYNFPDVASNVYIASIEKVTVKSYIKMATSSNERAKLALKIGSTIYYGTEFTPTTTNTLYTWERTTRPSDSGAWTKSNIDDLVAGVGHKSGLYTNGKYYGPYEYMTWVEVDYTISFTPKIIFI